MTDEAADAMVDLATVNLDGSLETQFKETAELALPKIKALLKEADDKFEEACKVAERYGVPFKTHMYDVEQQWTPQSFFDKFKHVACAQDGGARHGETFERLNDVAYEFDLAAWVDHEGFQAEWSSSSIGC